MKKKELLLSIWKNLEAAQQSATSQIKLCKVATGNNK